MKKITLTLVALVMTIGMFAENDLKISFCDNAVETIDEQQLLQCNELVVNSEEWKIKSLSLGYTADKNYYETKLEGNKVMANFIDSIKKRSPEYLYIEKIVLINNKGEEMKLDPQKLTITE